MLKQLVKKTLIIEYDLNNKYYNLGKKLKISLKFPSKREIKY